jgi:hypothetical protein
MEVWPPDLPKVNWWVDGETAVCCLDEPGWEDELRTYLLTGDRPMRMQVKGEISVLYHRDTKQWQAVCMVERDPVSHAVWTLLHDTPAEAILACAEAVCS